jgi:hypothetical protein
MRFDLRRATHAGSPGPPSISGAAARAGTAATELGVSTKAGVTQPIVR